MTVDQLTTIFFFTDAINFSDFSFLYRQRKIFTHTAVLFVTANHYEILLS